MTARLFHLADRWRACALGLVLVACLCLSPRSGAQSEEQVAEAQAFFKTYDLDEDTFLSSDEFVDGFIEQSRAEDPILTRMVLMLFGKRRVQNCLALGFGRADLSADGLLSFAELAEAYAADAFEGLDEMC